MLVLVNINDYQSPVAREVSLLATATRSGNSECKKGRTCKLIKAKVDRENIRKLGALDATNLEEHASFSFI